MGYNPLDDRSEWIILKLNNGEDDHDGVLDSNWNWCHHQYTHYQVGVVVVYSWDLIETLWETWSSGGVLYILIIQGIIPTAAIDTILIIWG